MLSPSEFIDLVAKMRSAQKKYFKERTQTALDQSISLERKVDEHIELEISRRGHQAEIFPTGKS